jgi:hypothetical protein
MQTSHIKEKEYYYIIERTLFFTNNTERSDIGWNERNKDLFKFVESSKKKDIFSILFTELPVL